MRPLKTWCLSPTYFFKLGNSLFAFISHPGFLIQGPRHLRMLFRRPCFLLLKFFLEQQVFVGKPGKLLLQVSTAIMRLVSTWVNQHRYEAEALVTYNLRSIILWCEAHSCSKGGETSNIKNQSFRIGNEIHMSLTRANFCKCEIIALAIDRVIRIGEDFQTNKNTSRLRSLNSIRTTRPTPSLRNKGKVVNVFWSVSLEAGEFRIETTEGARLFFVYTFKLFDAFLSN